MDPRDQVELVRQANKCLQVSVRVIPASPLVDDDVEASVFAGHWIDVSLGISVLVVTMFSSSFVFTVSSVREYLRIQPPLCGIDYMLCDLAIMLLVNANLITNFHDNAMAVPRIATLA